MAISQTAQAMADGNIGIAITVPFIVSPPPPVACGTTPPASLNLLSGLQQQVTGGTLTGGKNYYYFLTAIDSGGTESLPGAPIEVVVPSGTNTNKVTLSGLTPFDTNAVQYKVYRSINDPWGPLQIQAATGISLSGGVFTFTDTGLATSNAEPPSGEFFSTRLYWRPAGGTLWNLGAQTTTAPQTSLTFYVPLTIGGTSIDIQLRPIVSDGGWEMPQEIAPTTTYAVASPSPLIISGAHTSYRPLSNPLTATDAGAVATITVAAFTMRVAGKDISVNGGSLTGLAYNTLYYIYYDDAAYVGGAVTYFSSTAKTDTLNGASRFFVGSIRTPLATAPNTTGNNDGGASSQLGFNGNILAGSYTVALLGGSGNPVTNPQAAIDGNLITAATISVPANSGMTGVFTLNLFSGIGITYTSLVLNVRTAVTDNAGSGTATLQYSLDNGNTWTNIYSTTAVRSLTTDAITLSLTQNIAAVQVRATLSAGTFNATMLFYESWIVAQG